MRLDAFKHDPRLRRIGRFQISDEAIMEMRNFDELRRVFHGLVIVETCHTFNSYAHTEYIAIGDVFEEIPEGMMAPLYSVEIDPVSGDVIWNRTE